MIMTLNSLTCLRILNAQRLPTVGRADRCALGILQVHTATGTLTVLSCQDGLQVRST
jgi:hypothetical protein